MIAYNAGIGRPYVRPAGAYHHHERDPDLPGRKLLPRMLRFGVTMNDL